MSKRIEPDSPARIPKPSKFTKASGTSESTRRRGGERRRCGRQRGASDDQQAKGARRDFSSSAHENYLRGARRLLRAYTQLGCLVLVCPQLGFPYFKNSEMGNYLSQVLEKLELEKGDKHDQVRRKFVRMFIQSIKSQALSDVFGELQRVVAGVVDED
ncbi:hypothetical protein RhiJN_10251 [Ceratobasidium sp. AG-Ba]|nr:hypothetical protein RhiJN_10251 [Ceratobasidium sp. AG-Ba]QRW11004.1 hypothetical protein RhiLY_10003 [Ceratobasidium sp. AG-Ba]